MDYTFFRELTYLQQGSDTQCDAYRVLTAHGLMELLSDWGAILVGTIPLGIDVPDSDLDIACEAYDLKQFASEAYSSFGSYAGYSVREGWMGGLPYICIGFQCEDWPVELFAQPLPVEQQNGYRHMIAEYRVLQELDTTGHEEIRKRKRAGQKTEPAFADYLGLTGDPYAALLSLTDMDDSGLKKLVQEMNGAT